MLLQMGLCRKYEKDWQLLDDVPFVPGIHDGGMWKYLLFFALSVEVEAETVRGKVSDARTGEALERVRIEVVGGGAVVSGTGGGFELEARAGVDLNLRVSAPSYALLKLKISAGDFARPVEIALQPDADSVKASVTVVGNVFEGADGVAVPSEHTLNKQELQALGTSVIGDPLRSVQALPSVTTANDSRGEISVRGSAFEKVGLMVDGVLLDGFLHQIASDSVGSDRDRASFSIVTPDRISEVSLLNGAYSANHGLRNAGLVLLTTRDGNREKPDFRISSGLTLGTSIVHDAPFARKRGSYLVGLRSSALNPSNGGDKDLYSRFDDGQIKLLFDLSSRHRVGVSALMGRFRYEDRKEARTAALDQVTQANSASLAVMANWDWTLSPGAVVSTKLFHTQVGLNVLNRNAGLLGRLPRKQWGLRQDWNVGRFQAGVYLRSVEAEVNADRASTTEGSYYLQTTRKPSKTVSVTGGFRLERNRVSRETFVSPRISLAWNPGEGPLTFQMGYGRHRQFADLIDLVGVLGNRSLKAETTDHFTVSAQLRLSERSRLRVEGFERRDRDQVFRLNEPRFVAGRVVEAFARPENSLRGRARGFELMLQRRSGNRFSGWASYAYLHTKMSERLTGLTFATDNDQRHTGNLFGAYRLSESWSLNAIYRVSSGSPFGAFLRRDAQGRYFVDSQRNALRLRSYGRFDLRLNKTWTYRATRWSFVVEGLNLFNQGNLSSNGIERYDRATGQVLNPVTLYGFSRVGTAGVVLQF